jgi:hypothetical protein
MTGQPPLPAAARFGGPAGSEAGTLRPDNSAFVLQIVDNLVNNTVTTQADLVPATPMTGHQAMTAHQAMTGTRP